MLWCIIYESVLAASLHPGIHFFDQFYAVRTSGLLQQETDIKPDSPHGDRQLLGDLAIAAAPHNQFIHHSLPEGKLESICKLLQVRTLRKRLAGRMIRGKHCGRIQLPVELDQQNQMRRDQDRRDHDQDIFLVPEQVPRPRAGTLAEPPKSEPERGEVQ